ncbi:hypothetical protein BDU57DRAFT_512298 [Ampelomyces quisqualis]|uniref:Uncharacterized protein n=1 Tax=Ampelomyces quisqualis TaxID=50730 RepID=A0A6A5QUY8_AMPQU|nr:hypothetical protein BDU57DRAFT_512298 [Ampelomyces quisqualis]
MVALKGGNAYPINQLKYVNPQSYHETAGLEIGLNTVIFQSDTYRQAGATLSLFMFISRCSPPKLHNWLRRVKLRENADYTRPKEQRGPLVWIEDNMRYITKLMKFCAQHQQITVELAIPNFCIVRNEDEYEPLAFLWAGVFLKSAFRTTDVVEIVTYSGTSQRKMRKLYFDVIHKEHQRDVERLRGKSTNLRFCVDRKKYMVDLYLDKLVDHWSRTIGVPHPQLKDDWVKFAREWTQYGI